MNFDLSREHELLRDTVRQFAIEKVAPVAEELDREKRFPYELIAELAELGLLGMTIPEEYGGGGTDTLSLRDRDRGADPDRLRRWPSPSPPTIHSGRCRSTSSAPRSNGASGCPTSRAAAVWRPSG